MNTETGWIKPSNRPPMGPFTQIWVLWGNGIVNLSQKKPKETWQEWFEIMKDKLVAWQPCEVPEPPPAPTQREADEAAYSLWYCSPLSTRYSDAREMAWHSALAYERAAILALTYQRGHPGMSCSAAMDRIQERCAP